MRKIFDILLLCFCLLLGDISAESWVNGTQRPADVYLNYKFKLKNREVIKKQQYLFTRVNLKAKPNSSDSLNESKASLYAQQNFARYLYGQIRWKDNFSPTEKRMIQSLYWQVTSVSAVLRGLTLIHTFSQNDLQSYIYAANVPTVNIRKVTQHEIIEKIQRSVIAENMPLDYMTYLEIALRRPELFSPKIGVKRLGKFCGQNFIFFLLGMDLSNPKTLTGISKVSLSQLVDLDKYQIAVLIDKRPWDINLALAFAQKLLKSNHEELAKLTIKNGCRLEKFGKSYDEMYKLVQKWQVDPSGAYRYPIDSFSHQQLLIEQSNSGLALNSLSEAVLNSLGDVPLKNSEIQQFFPAGDYTGLAPEEFKELFQELQSSQESVITGEFFEAIGELLYAGGFPLMAYCFYHQAFYLDPGDQSLRN